MKEIVVSETSCIILWLREVFYGFGSQLRLKYIFSPYFDIYLISGSFKEFVLSWPYSCGFLSYYGLSITLLVEFAIKLV